jgi:phospholipid transport system transporter-binding protein
VNRALERRADGSFVVRGDLSFETVPDLWKESQQAFRAASSLVIDLGEVGVADSAGLALLLEWLHLSRQGGAQLRYAHVPEGLRALARIAEVEDLLADPAGAQADSARGVLTAVVDGA